MKIGPRNDAKSCTFSDVLGPKKSVHTHAAGSVACTKPYKSLLVLVGLSVSPTVMFRFWGVIRPNTGGTAIEDEEVKIHSGIRLPYCA